MKTKFKLRPHGTDIPLSGGFRVNEYGLIEVLEDSIVIWGIHNNIVWKDKVSKGYLFNSLNIVGDWHDVVPIWERKDGIYFRKIGDSIPATEVDKKNKLNKIKIRKIYKKTDNNWN